MNYPILNLLLLSLSLTVMLLTLAGWLLYRPRSRASSAPPPTGLAPDFKATAPATAPLLPEAGAMPRAWRRRAGALAATAVALAALGTLPRWWGPSREAPRDFSALYQQGLLRSYEYAPTPVARATAWRESALPEDRERIAALATRLSGLRIALLRLSGSPLGLSPFHEQAFAHWREFLRARGLRAVEVRDALDVPADLIVLPQALALNDRQRASLEAALGRGVGLLATGPTGALNGLGKPDAGDWGERWLGLKIEANPEAGRNLPTLVAAPAPSIGALPPGAWFDWLPLDNSYRALSEAGQDAPLLEADHQGVATSAVRALRRESDARIGRRAWSALDPGQWDAWPETQRLRAEEILLSTLAWAARQPLSRVATWPDGHRSALAVALTADGDARALEGALSARQRPATLLLDPSAWKPADWERLKPRLAAANLELAPQTAARAPDGEAAFAQLQTARLTLEALAQTRIRGAQTGALAAALENKIDYIYTESPATASGPAWIADGRLLALPRTPAGPALRGELARNAALGGALLVEVPAARFRSLQTEIEAERPATWHPTLAELSAWWQTRRAITASIGRAGDGSLQLHVRNQSGQAANGVVIEVDPGQPGPWQRADASPITREAGGPLRVPLARLEGGEQRVIALTSKRP